MKKTLLSLCALALGAVALLTARAADSSTETVAVQTTTRVAEVVISAPAGADPIIAISRERSKSVAGEVISRQIFSTSSRKFSAIASESVTLASGKTLTPAEMQEAIVLYAARWKTEDDLAAAPTPPPEVP